jgi:hypothetical protein
LSAKAFAKADLSELSANELYLSKRKGPAVKPQAKYKWIPAFAGMTDAHHAVRTTRDETPYRPGYNIKPVFIPKSTFQIPLVG